MNNVFPVCMYVHNACACCLPWNWGYRWLSATVWVLESNLSPSQEHHMCSQPLNHLFGSLQRFRNTLWKRNIFLCTCLLLYFLVGTKENIRVFKILIFFILIGLKIYIRYIETGKKHSRRKRINFK